MTHPIVWTDMARDDLRAIVEDLHLERPADVPRLRDALQWTADGLAANPYSGSIGRVTATRELTLPDLPYLAVFMVLPASVTVLRLLPHDLS